MWRVNTRVTFYRVLKRLRLDDRSKHLPNDKACGTGEMCMAAVRRAHVDPVHHPECPQRPPVHQNWTTEQRKKVVWTDVKETSPYLGNRQGTGCTMWEEGKPEEAVWCSTQCSAGKPRVPAFIWTPFRPQSKHCCGPSRPSWQRYALMAVASFSRLKLPATRHTFFANGSRNAVKSSRCRPGENI